ncbi:MAG: transcriptional repressor [Methylobacterium mesophilicum]|nr:transcriptional repressor [Methylobacterium mesophilicum]
MARSPKPSSEKALRRAGIRITRQRKVILKVLEENDHLDAPGIHARASGIDPSISLSTVYRTMKLLEDQGAIHRHAFGDGPARFEGAHGAHHDHLIDIETGDVIEFTSSKIEELQQAIADSLGYDIVHHRLELYGRRRKPEANPPPAKE